MKRTFVLAIAIFGLGFLSSPIIAPVFGQKQNKFTDAIQRSGDAGRIIELLALLPDSGLPKELIDKAEAVGVFPKIGKETVGL